MMKRIFQYIKSNPYPILSGLMVGTSYVPFPPWAVAWAWIPLWLSVLREDSLKKVFFQGWISQFILTLIGFYWIAYVCHDFGYMPWPIAIGALILFAATIHIYIGLALVLARYLGKRFQLSVGAQLGLMAVFHVMGETYWPSMFSWNLAYSLVPYNLALAQTADIFGFLGLSLIFHLMNAGLARAWLSKKIEVRLAVAGSCVLIFAGLSYWGVQRQKPWLVTDSQLSVLIVQPNVGNHEKMQAERGFGYRREIVDKFFSLTEMGLKKQAADLIVWPETAFPDFLGAHNAERGYTRFLKEFAQKIKTPILTGGYGNAPPGEPRAEYNTLQIYDTTGTPVASGYNKTILLIFGEYTPFGDLFPILKKWNPGGEGWGRGSGPITLDLVKSDQSKIKIGPQICYESLFPYFSAASTSNGAEILVNLTNDSWFGPYSEPYQNRAMTLARAIENRRPLIRSTNTGISSVILASGQVLGDSPLFTEWTQHFEIQFRSSPDLTFFTKYRIVFHPLLFFLAGVFIVIGRSRLVRNR